MTTTMTINDRLVELGVLGNQKDKTIQRAGAMLVDEFFQTFNKEVDEDTTVALLHYLTDIQVRDFALGILDKYETKPTLAGLNYLLDKAPTDTAYINAPASLLATFLYERGDSASAAVTLSNAQHHYPLAILLSRVMKAGWPASSFAAMRTDIHPKVEAGIFGEQADDQA